MSQMFGPLVLYGGSKTVPPVARVICARFAWGENVELPVCVIPVTGTRMTRERGQPHCSQGRTITYMALPLLFLPRSRPFRHPRQLRVIREPRRLPRMRMRQIRPCFHIDRLD